MLPAALPILNLLVPGSGKVVGDIQAIATKANWQSVDDLENDAEVLALNYDPIDKPIFDGVKETLRGIEHTIVAVEAKNTSKAITA